jgi:DNA-binding response OmpR family regulator
VIDNEANKSLTPGRFSGNDKRTTQDSKGPATVGLPLLTKVLVVDVDVLAVHSLAAALREAGYFALEATSFADAKRLLVSESPEILVADVRLGQFNGLQLLMRAREDRPETRVVITCAFHDVVLEAETHRFGGVFLLKPLDPQQVLTAIGAPTQFPQERRREERRTVLIPFSPERRVAQRRANAVFAESSSAEGRRLVVPDFSQDMNGASRPNKGRDFPSA